MAIASVSIVTHSIHLFSQTDGHMFEVPDPVDIHSTNAIARSNRMERGWPAGNAYGPSAAGNPALGTFGSCSLRTKGAIDPNNIYNAIGSIARAATPPCDSVPN
eukprot:3968134-Prymnesium_polylepis.1